jgi:dipeptidyl aminopeptidase/acylaminoacyl peptidase
MPRHAKTAIFLIASFSYIARAADENKNVAATTKNAEQQRTFHALQETSISPDGKQVAWVEGFPPKDGSSSGHSLIFIANVGSSPAKAWRLTTGDETCSESAPRWSPDGKQLAFLSDRGSSGQLQVHVAPAGGGQARRMTNLKDPLADLSWSPDGTHIGFLFTEDAPHGVGPVQPGLAETGEIGTKAYYQRLSVLDLESGKSRQVSPADLYVYEYDWAPDGKRCVLSAAHGPGGDNNWYIAQLFVLTLESGANKAILKPDMQIAVPRWSPDGSTIAFIGGLMSDEGVTGGDVFTVPAAGGKPVNRTPNLDASASWLAWQTTKQLLFTEHIGGGSGIARVDVDGSVKRLWKADETITAEGGSFAVSASRDRQTLALIRQSFHEPPEVWAGPVGQLRPMTDANQGIAPACGKAKSLHWKNDAFRIQGWLLYPRTFDVRQRYPLVVDVHGGPASAVTPRWLGQYSVAGALASQGFFVFLPNPRGSYGQGEHFTRANVKDFGHGDWRDILAGVDEVLRTESVDKDRLGIYGWSYGGYMTMWGVTQTNRFRAAVAWRRHRQLAKLLWSERH